MLGLLIIIAIFFSVGRRFYSLAMRYRKNGWVFGILGVVSYYVGTNGSDLIIGLLINYTDLLEIFLEIGTVGLVVINISVGIITCITFYQILKRVWSKEKENMGLDDDVLDADMISGRRD